MSAWVQLAAAIGLEIAGTVMLKLSDGFAKWHWGLLSILLYGLCFWVFAPALKAIPIGVAYAVWSGVGIAAVTIVGLLAFGEQLRLAQLGFIALILAGAAGLRYTTPA